MKPVRLPRSGDVRRGRQVRPVDAGWRRGKGEILRFETEGLRELCNKSKVGRTGGQQKSNVPFIELVLGVGTVRSGQTSVWG